MWSHSSFNSVEYIAINTQDRSGRVDKIAITRSWERRKKIEGKPSSYVVIDTEVGIRQLRQITQTQYIRAMIMQTLTAYSSY